jgi:hypothetical protein
MHSPYAPIAETLPSNFAPPEAWPEYGAIAMPKSICSREKVGTDVPGIRWGVWPFYFEEYVGDAEPDLSLSAQGRLAYPRIIAWKRLRRHDIPKGWRVISRRPWRVDGFFELDHNEDYVKRWKKNARRDLRLWQESVEDGRYRIEEISLEEFLGAYNKSTVAKKISPELGRVLERKFALPDIAQNFVLWGVRDIKSGSIIAGTAGAYSPTHESSIRECPFILHQARATYASTGLMDHWFKESQKRGTKILNFTHFRQWGDPRDWKGFSEFKSHFGPTLAAYPPILWRVRPGKIF